MINVLNNAVSGLQAQSTKLAVGAANIANASSKGSLDPNHTRQPYQSLDVDVTSQSSDNINGGVQASVRIRDPGSVASYEPESSFADENGQVAVPNVDFSEELTNNLLAAQAYKANAQLISVAKDLDEALFNALDEKV